VPPTIEERELTCKELVELVTEYLEGKLSLDDHRRFSEHLVLCDGCQVYVQEMRVMIATLGRLTEQSISTGPREKLLHVFRRWKA
jgi:anti-sigma factor RsiW